MTIKIVSHNEYAAVTESGNLGTLGNINVAWDDIPKLVADLLEQKRQHEARKAHGEAIAARRAANTPWDTPKQRSKGMCAPSLRLSD